MGVVLFKITEQSAKAVFGVIKAISQMVRITQLKTNGRVQLFKSC
jgi:hypothetical protein